MFVSSLARKNIPGTNPSITFASSYSCFKGRNAGKNKSKFDASRYSFSLPSSLIVTVVTPSRNPVEASTVTPYLIEIAIATNASFISTVIVSRHSSSPSMGTDAVNRKLDLTLELFLPPLLSSSRNVSNRSRNDFGFVSFPNLTSISSQYFYACYFDYQSSPHSLYFIHFPSWRWGKPRS